MRFKEISEDSKKPKLNDAQLQAWAVAAAEKYDVPLPLMMHVMRNETGHLASDPNRRANAISPANAQGIMQIQPDTGKQHGLKNPFDPKQNIDAGARILGALLYKYDGDHNSALAAYNAGQGTVDDYLNGTNKTGKNPKLRTTDSGVPPFKETQHYIFGQTDKKGNVIKPAYDPKEQYDVDAIKSAATAAPSVTKTDPIAVAQAKIDKMPRWDRSKGEPVPAVAPAPAVKSNDPVVVGVTAPSQAQVRASDNKIAAAAPPAEAPVTTPPVVKPAPVIQVTPGGDAKRSAPVVKAEPAPAPVVKSEPPPPKPVVAPSPASAGVDVGGAGRVGPTIAASKGADASNPLNKQTTPTPASVTKVEPTPVVAPTGDWKSIAQANKIDNPNLIKPGQELKLPGDLTYTVSKGDTLSGIASGNYKGTAPVTPPAAPPPETSIDRLKTLSGNAINNLTQTIKKEPPIPPVIKADADDLEKPAVAETFKTINTQRYPFLLGL